MRFPLTSLVLAMLLAFVTPAAAGEPDFTPSPDPSRIVLNPAANPATGQLITWRTDVTTLSGSVEYRPAAGGAVSTVAATPGLPVLFGGWAYTSIHHTARLTGLTPGTAYSYRVGTAGHWSEWFTFETATADRSPWEMIYFGDAQNNLDVAWKPVVEQAFKRTPNAKLALHAGDLINNSSIDAEWGYWFEGMKGPAQTVNQFVVTGNHERSSDALGTQFREHFATAGNGPLLADSTVYFTDYQGVRLIAIDGNGTALFDQIDFLENALENNPNQWTVVSFHQPIFSGAAGRDNGVNRHFLLPILRKYNVDLVLQGHDHVYARGVMASDLDSATGDARGPVYTVAVAGPKYYSLSPAESNNWTENEAVRVIAHEQTSTWQPITFDGNRLTYRSYIAAKGAESTASGQVGDLLDAFTITKTIDGAKVVSEGEVPPDVDPDPDPDPKPAKLKVRKVSRNLKNGTARITLVATGAGSVTVSSTPAGRIRRITRPVPASRPVTLTLRASRSASRKLRRKSRLPVKVSLRFKPSSGPAQVLTRKVNLVRRKR